MQSCCMLLTIENFVKGSMVIHMKQKKKISRQLYVLFRNLYILIVFLICGGTLFLLFYCHKLHGQIEQLDEERFEKESKIIQLVDVIEQLQNRLYVAESLDIKETETGFRKKAGVYLIESEAQIYKLEEMIENGKEIEEGVYAANASYRLTEDISIREDWVRIGNSQRTFHGIFDGDGHGINGCFPGRSKVGAVQDFLVLGENAKVVNLSIRNTIGIRESLYLSVKSEEEAEYVKEKIKDFEEYNLQITVEDMGVETESLIKGFKEFCESSKEHGKWCCIRVSEWNQGSGTMPKSLKSLEGLAEKMDIGKEEYISFWYQKRLDDLTVQIVQCYDGENEDDYWEYDVFLEGTWEGKMVNQHLIIPITDMGSLLHEEFNGVSCEDINFDGKSDLLIEEGYSDGSGGSWKNIRGITWNSEREEFEFFISLPEQVTCLDFDSERLIVSVRCGWDYEQVTEYKVVNGEYVKARELTKESEMHTDDEGNSEVGTYLNYYVMGEKVQSHLLPEDYRERQDMISELYPDLDYFQNG